MKRVFGLAVFWALCAIFLTGCVNGQLHVTLNRDSSANLDYRLVIDASFLMVLNGQDPLAGMRVNAATAGFTLADYSEGKMVGFKAVKHVANLTELSDSISGLINPQGAVQSAGSAAITGVAAAGAVVNGLAETAKGQMITVKKGLLMDQYRFETNIDLTDLKSMVKHAYVSNALLSQAKLRFILTLPVKAETSNAQTVSDGGKTLEWVLVPGENNLIQAEVKLPNVKNIALAAALGMTGVWAVFNLVFRRIKHHPL